MNIKYIFCGLVFLLFFSCKPSKSIIFAMENLEMQYADRNGNVYKISGNKMYYDPVKMEESSSGMYSGGEEKEINLTEGEAKKILEAFDRGIKDTQYHTTKRTKGSGAIQKINTKKNISVILVSGSPTQIEIENLLESYLRK